MEIALRKRSGGNEPCDAEQGKKKLRVDGRTAMRLFTVVFALYLAVGSTLNYIVNPVDAMAVPDPNTGIEYGEGIYSGNPDNSGSNATITATGESLLDQFLVAPFLSLANTMMGASRWMINETASTSALTSQFNQIAPNLIGIMQNVHHTFVVPFANVVAVIVFTVGLVKLVANSSVAEGGIDTWKLIMTFIMFGAATVVINASWEIMVALYTLAVKLVSNIAGYMGTINAASTTIEGSNNAAVAIAAVLTTFLMMLVTAIACLVVNVTILMRGLEIYLYACYSPIPFAFMVTEGGRQQTEMFLKRYTALLLAGAIQILIMIAFAATSGVMGQIGAFNENTDAAAWIAQYILTFAWLIVVAFMMLRSTTIARDLIGIS